MTKEIGNGFYSNFSRPRMGKMKLSGGDTAERHAVQLMLGCQFQTGAVTGRQFLLISVGDAAMDHGADGMKDVPGGKMIPFGQLGSPIGFRVPLEPHHSIAFVAKLETSRGMNGIINTSVTGMKATEQAGISGVHDGVCLQPGNISLPDGDLRIQSSCCQNARVNNPFLF